MNKEDETNIEEEEEEEANDSHNNGLHEYRPIAVSWCCERETEWKQNRKELD